ncbi:MAG: D-alanine--D-alanine ligase family protein [Desulfovibrionaceae bacterium]
MKVLLLAGGWSSERNVSLQSVSAIQEALESLGHSVTVFDPISEFPSLLSIAKQHDFAFINLHGAGGEDGVVQALLEYIDCPYQSSSLFGSYLSLNKTTTKMIYEENNLPTSPYIFLGTLPPKDFIIPLRYPVFVKANTGGSSLFLYKANTIEEVNEAVKKIINAGDTVLIEEAVLGEEITCGVLHKDVLPPVLIKPKKKGFFDYETKYDTNAVEELCPAPLPEKSIIQIQKYAMQAHVALRLGTYSRTDMIIDGDDIVLLETNTIPGMTKNSLFPKEAHAIGMSFIKLIESLLKKV